MGADLYILKIHKKGEYFAFDGTLSSIRRGYFRDVYNEAGLFGFIRSNTSHKSLSWWSLRDREWFNHRKNMTMEGTKKFLELMIDAKEQIYSKQEFCLVRETWNPNEGKSTTEVIPLTCFDVLEYKEWLECLIAFLELAIKKKSTIRWSV